MILGDSIEKFYRFSIEKFYTVKSNLDRIIIHFLTNNLKMDDSPEAIAEKTIELIKSANLATIEVVISSIITRRNKLADKGSKVSNIVKNFFKKIRQTSFCGKDLLIQRNIFERMAYTSNFGITQIVNNFFEFFNYG